MRKVTVKKVLEVKGLQFPITLHQRSDGKFVVTYGQQVTSRPHSTQALEELKNCIRHALELDGVLDHEK